MLLEVKRPQWIPRRPELPGLAIASVTGVVAIAIAHVVPPSPLISDILIAMVLGALLANSGIGRFVGLAAPQADEREPDRAAAGLRFVSKWVLRLGIILMGLKVQTSFFGRSELTTICGIAAVS